MSGWEIATMTNPELRSEVARLREREAQLELQRQAVVNENHVHARTIRLIQVRAEAAEARVAELTREYDGTLLLKQLAEARVAEVTKERDEWEERYNELLSEIGGVSPG